MKGAVEVVEVSRIMRGDTCFRYFGIGRARSVRQARIAGL